MPLDPNAPMAVSMIGKRARAILVSWGFAPDAIVPHWLVCMAKFARDNRTATIIETDARTTPGPFTGPFVSEHFFGGM
jgi:hypothetical protein